MGRTAVTGVVALATTTVGGALGLVVLARLAGSAGSRTAAATPAPATSAATVAPGAALPAVDPAAATPSTAVVTPLAGGDFVGVALGLLAAALVVGGLVVLAVALADRVLARGPGTPGSATSGAGLGAAPVSSRAPLSTGAPTSPPALAAAHDAPPHAAPAAPAHAAPAAPAHALARTNALAPASAPAPGHAAGAGGRAGDA